MNSADEHGFPQRRLAKIASDLLYSVLQQDAGLFDGCKVDLARQGNSFFNNPASLFLALRKAILDCHTFS